MVQKVQIELLKIFGYVAHFFLFSCAHIPQKVKFWWPTGFHDLNFFSDFLTETTDRHLLKDVQSQLNCSTLVNILKTFMAVSSDVIRSKVNSASFLSISIRADCYASKENSHFLKKETSKDISEMAFQFLKIICSESWVKEKCLKDVDQFNTNLLVSFFFFLTIWWPRIFSTSPITLVWILEILCATNLNIISLI